MIGRVPAPDKRKRFPPKGENAQTVDKKLRARDARPYTVSE